MKVRSEIANQFIIEDGGSVYFQSYGSRIAKRCLGRITLDRKYRKYWEDYSDTTGRYRRFWRNMS